MRKRPSLEKCFDLTFDYSTCKKNQPFYFGRLIFGHLVETFLKQIATTNTNQTETTSVKMNVSLFPHGFTDTPTENNINSITSVKNPPNPHHGVL